MTATVQKWGNSLALRLPKTIARDLRIGEGDGVELKIRGDSLVVKSVRPQYRLADLMRGVRPGNLHRETNWGAPAGKEVW